MQNTIPSVPTKLYQSAEDQERRLGLLYELMSRRVSDILLVSSLYDCCIMEEDGRLAERIIHEYRGLNLSRPPRITRVSTAVEALAILEGATFELVIIMPRMTETDPSDLARDIKQQHPDLPILELTHRIPPPNTEFDTCQQIPGVDRTFIWSGNTDLLVAQIKSVEDRWNVAHDTQVAGVRVILLVEDSLYYLSSLLPILYREVVTQTQAAMEEGLNEEHRLLTMRSRAKILIAQSYEEAVELFEQFSPYLLGVISDMGFPRGSQLDPAAGAKLLGLIRSEIPDLPLLLTSSDPQNKEKADAAGVAFIDKNSSTLHNAIHSFFLDHLGFGDFIFRLPDGEEVARASNRLDLERVLGESLLIQ